MTTLSCASIDLFLNSLSVQGGSEHTTKAYRSDLKGFLAWWEAHHPYQKTMLGTLEENAARYLTANRKKWAPRTVLRKVTALRSYAKWAGEPATFLENYRLPTPEKAEPHPVVEGIPGVELMLEVARTPQKQALVALCGLMGLRVSEACDVVPVWLDVPTMTLKVIGKGSKTRHVPISAKAWRYLEVAYAQAVQNGSSLVGIQERGARASISSLARRAKLSRHVASHDLRATFATRALEATMDIRAVQELLGHASVETTQIYTSTSDARKRGAVEAI